MGLDLGLMKAGLKIVASQDFDKWCVATILRNGHLVVPGDLRNLLASDPSCDFILAPSRQHREKVFAVVGGPPCQAFSTAGKRLGLDDLRGSLYSQFLKVVASIRPRFFVMENVKGLSSMHIDPKDKESPLLLDHILLEAEALGYKTIHGILDAVHYGAPEFRERLVIIGSRENEDIYLPKPTHFPIHQNPAMRWKTLKDAIGDLEGSDMVCAKFSPRQQKFLKAIPEGKNWRSLPPAIAKEALGGAHGSGGGKTGFFRRLSYEEPSPTLVTSPTQKATMLCHPRETRPLSVKEYARIQGFPDSWIIEGHCNDCYRQIGNAVPVLLGEALGQMLVSVALGNSQVRTRRHRGTSVHSTVGYC